MGNRFDPDAYLKKKENDQAHASGFDPDAYLNSRKKIQPQSKFVTEESQPLAVEEEIYKGFPIRQTQFPDNDNNPIYGSVKALETVLNKNRKAAIDRVVERSGKERGLKSLITGDDGGDRLGDTIGDGIYKFSNVFGNVVPKGVALGETLQEEAPGFIQDAFRTSSPEVTEKLKTTLEKYRRGELPTATSERPEPEKGFWDKYEENKAIEEEVARVRQERSPKASFLGELGSLIAPYNLGMKILSGAPVVGKGVQGARKVPELLKLLTRGAITNTAIGQLQGHDLSDAPVDAAFGAGGEAVGKIASAGFGKVKNFINALRKSNELGTLPQKLNYMLDSIPIVGKVRKGMRDTALEDAKSAFEANKQGIANQLDELQTQFSSNRTQNSEKLNELRDLQRQSVDDAQNAYRYNKEATRNELRDLSQFEPAELGAQFSNKIKNSKQKLSNEYGEVSDRLMAQHGDTPASVDDLRKEITDTLRKNELLDSNGKIDPTKIDLIQSPDRKRMVQTLVNMTEALQANPTIKGLNALKQDLQSLSNHGAPVRTAEQSLFGKLADKAKISLDNALEQASGEGAQEFKAVRQKYAQQKPNLDTLSKTATRLPERLVVNARVQFPKSKVQEILKTNPEFKDDIGNFIFEHITQTPATQNTIRKTMDYYGRDFLKSLLGEGKFGQLAKMEKQFESAFGRFSPKNFPNEKVQSQIGKLLGDSEVGPHSFDSAKRALAQKDAELATKFNIEAKDLRKKKLIPFQFVDPKEKKIQNLLSKLIGTSGKPEGKTSRFLKGLINELKYLGPTIGSQTNK